MGSSGQQQLGGLHSVLGAPERPLGPEAVSRPVSWQGNWLRSTSNLWLYQLVLSYHPSPYMVPISLTFHPCIRCVSDIHCTDMGRPVKCVRSVSHMPKTYYTHTRHTLYTHQTHIRHIPQSYMHQKHTHIRHSTHIRHNTHRTHIRHSTHIR